MSKFILHVIALCLGTFIYTYMTDQDYSEAAQNAYFMTFGAWVTYFRFVSLNKVEKWGD